MPNSRAYDAIIIGTGQAGKPLAKSLAKSGKKTAIIERDDKVGGSCVVYGCTPTKTMVASSQYLKRLLAGATSSRVHSQTTIGTQTMWPLPSRRTNPLAEKIAI